MNDMYGSQLLSMFPDASGKQNVLPLNFIFLIDFKYCPNISLENSSAIPGRNEK